MNPLTRRALADYDQELDMSEFFYLRSSVWVHLVT